LVCVWRVFVCVCVCVCVRACGCNESPNETTALWERYSVNKWDELEAIAGIKFVRSTSQFLS
jgi:hypothetical protein